MEKNEIAEIGALFADNKFNASQTNLSQDKVEPVAIIATVVDILRKDIEKVTKKGYKHGVPIPISVFEKVNKKIYDALRRIGCENLIDIMGWRKYWIDDSSIVVYQIRVVGVYRSLPTHFSILDIREIARIMEAADLPFEEEID